MRVLLPTADQHGKYWILAVVLLFLCIDDSHSFPHLVRNVFGVHRHGPFLTIPLLPSTSTSTSTTSLSTPTTSTSHFHFRAHPYQKTSVSKSSAKKTSTGVSSSHVRATSTELSSLITDVPFVEDISVFKRAKASTSSSSSRHLRVVEVPIWKSYIRRPIAPRGHIVDPYTNVVVMTNTAQAATATTFTLVAGNWTMPTPIPSQTLTTNRPMVTLTYSPHSVPRTENRLETLALHSSIPNSPVPPTKQSLIRAQMDALREKYERQQAEAKSKALAEQKIKAAFAQKAAWMAKFREEHTHSIENQQGDIEYQKE